MSKKPKTAFVCQSCGYVSPRWMGKCPECESWNTLVEETTGSTKTASRTALRQKPTSLADISTSSGPRDRIGIPEFDRVLGGGIVPGGVFLIGGAPGMGKSTLLLQACYSVASGEKPVLYVSGEESLPQIKLRADRLGMHAEKFLLLAETDVDQIAAHIDTISPAVTVIDSVQTVSSPLLESLPGNISQVRHCGQVLTTAAKQSGTAMFIVGHVTKDGTIAGPRVLEHLVDGLILLEGDRQHQYRLLRAVKNRFGSTNEIGIFEMSDRGMIAVENPSEYLSSVGGERAAGTAVTVCIEGTRPLMVEIQALVTQSYYGVPQRTVTGIPPRRVSILLAVLEKRLGLRFGSQDVFVNTAGGLQIQEPATDLAVIAALMSSLKNSPVSRNTAYIGEVGLTGEVRGISHIDKRISEAARLGCSAIVVPAINANKQAQKKSPAIIGIESVGDLADYL